MAASRFVRSSLVVTITARAWRTPACSSTEAIRAFPWITGMPRSNSSPRNGAAGGHLDRHDALAHLEQAADDLVADLADPDHDEMVAAERGEHAIPLREVLLAGEHQERQPDHRVGDGAQAHDREQEEQRLQVPLVGEVERRLQEDHQEDGVAGPGERQAPRGRRTGGGSSPPPSTSAAKTASGQRNSQSKYRTNRRYIEQPHAVPGREG